MQLRFGVTDLFSNPVARFWDFWDAEITEPLNDGLTARVTISMGDKAAGIIRPLKHVLKVYYGPFIVFNGIITLPDFDYEQGTVEINAVDPSFRLQHSYLRYGDIAVDIGYPLDGIGLRQVVEASIPLDPQLDRGMPPNGILWGVDETDHQGPQPTEEPPEEGAGIWRKAERGAEVWDTVLNMVQTVGGPDIWLEPIDNLHPGVDGVPPAGYLVQLHAYDRRGEDLSETIKFEHGTGRNNAQNITHGPDGSSVRNYFVEVYPGGERNREDSKRKALVHDADSWMEYGIMQGWESSGQKDSNEVLKQKATAWVKAYGQPPDFFTVTPNTDQSGVPVYRQDYNVGDVIGAHAKKAECEFIGVGRIVQATLTQVDRDGTTRVELECVPNIENDPGEGEDG